MLAFFFSSQPSMRREQLIKKNFFLQMPKVKFHSFLSWTISLVRRAENGKFVLQSKLKLIKIRRINSWYAKYIKGKWNYLSLRMYWAKLMNWIIIIAFYCIFYYLFSHPVCMETDLGISLFMSFLSIDSASR